MIENLSDKELAQYVKRLKNAHDALTDDDIKHVLCHRANILRKLQSGDSTNKIAAAMKYYSPVRYEDENGDKQFDIEKSAQACINFIEDWGMIYNPHRTTIMTVPVILFQRQKEYIRWLMALYATKTNGCVDKCRDVGATWVAIQFSCWLCIFERGITLGFYTFNAEECDALGNLSTLLPKARFFLRNLPTIFTGKEGVDWTTKQYQIINKRNSASLLGLKGKAPGRSGRTTMVFKDESAFYENADEVEAALGENTSVSVDISTPNGTETVFYRKKRGMLNQIEKYGVGPVLPIFTFDWDDNPNHTPEWFEKKKREAEYEGRMHIFKREVLRDETSSLSDRVIPSAFIAAAVDAHLVLAEKFPLTGRRAGFDVANSEVDGDTNTYVFAQGNRIDKAVEWAGLDALSASKKVWRFCSRDKVSQLVFDAIGVGATSSNHFREQEDLQDGRIQQTSVSATAKPEDFVSTEFIPFVAHARALRPDAYEYSQDVTNQGLFRDCKAQMWWHARLMFENTWRAVNGNPYDPDMLVSINMNGATDEEKIVLMKMIEELGQPTFSAKSNRITIDKKPKSARSPNLADACVMCLAPVEQLFSLEEIV
jgi:phage terminase large subunit